MKLKKAHLWILIDIAMYAIILVVFALFHHGLVTEYKVEPEVVNQIAETPAPTPALTPAPDNTSSDTTPEPTATIDPNDLLQGKYPDKFTDGEITKNDNQYISGNISITIERIDLTGETEEECITYYVADIYIKYIDCFRSALALNKYGRAIADDFINVAQENNSILAITGDFYSVRTEGVVLRNGLLYRDEPWGDVLIMYLDGSIRTFSEDEFDIDQAISDGAYQGWSFGPMMLDNGQPMTEFSFENSIHGKNPRCAIGYYEPGHYCFVTVDGRGQDGSSGMTFIELSNMFYNLGCTAAYNLDGGGSAKMYFDGDIHNNPSNKVRGISDILYIRELESVVEE